MRLIKRILLFLIILVPVFNGLEIKMILFTKNHLALAADVNGLKGEYYDNADFTGLKLVRKDADINFNWGVGSPNPVLEADGFSVRWTGTIKPRYSELFTFYIVADDGVRLWVDGRLLIDVWEPQASELKSLPILLTSGKNHDIRIEYFENDGGATAILQWSSASQTKQVVPQSQLNPPAETAGVGLKGEYYDNSDLSKLKLTRTDSEVNFNWGASAPHSSMQGDTFSVRWTGTIKPKYSESYTFFLNADDGVRLWIDGRLILDKWLTQASELTSQTITLNAGHNYDIRIEYFENSGGATAILAWSSASQAKQVVPKSQLYIPVEVDGVGLKAEYYNNLDLDGLVLTRTDKNVNFNWGDTSPHSSIESDTFSVRWTGKIKPKYNEKYTFYLTADDGVRLWIDGKLILNRWVNQAGQYPSRTIQLIAGNQYDIQIDYFENVGGAAIGLWWESKTQKKEFVPQSQLYSSATGLQGTGLKAEYFNNEDLTELKLSRTDANINFNWGIGSPDVPIEADSFSARWMGTLRPKYSGSYTFYADSDDGLRLWVNGQLLIDKWVPQASELTSIPIYLNEGQNYDIQVEYFESGGAASCRISWSSAAQVKEVIPQSQLYMPYRSYIPLEYHYDINGRLDYVKESESNIIRYHYDKNGNLVNVTE
ncbi:hypothetical protein C2I18_00990 [Paenibacillus sp. PK3_47]|uniref:PA14 domain-containing protein n=1 Tax=Paenibacillus sp. PK3_47 TaxID=2072642 RepID=UPI00201DF6A0|nr:PA14 domain-containing protein [Paenibacillus sp. PK3_47]UQZ32243.1 hypothetical protein C2I18_00990 [Paenibacillus sp. PK3_47]